MMLRTVLQSTLGLALLSGSLTAAEWSQFRGPTGQGHAESAHDLPLNWGEDQNVVWKTELPGKGWSSAVIEGDQIWMTMAVTTPVSEEEKERRLKDNTGSQPLNVAGELDMYALCVDRVSGNLRHKIKLMSQKEPEPIHTLNSYASPTPLLLNGKLFCHFGPNGTACLDTKTQQVLWTNQELVVKTENGAGSSPIAWQNLIIFHCDGSDVQYVVALDQKTGEVEWKTDRTGKMNSNPQLKKSYATPLIVNVKGKPQLISPGSDWVYGYDPATGKELWKLNYGDLGFSIVPRPVAGNGMVYFCTSYLKSQMIAVQLDGSDGNPEPHIAWKFRRQVSSMPSPLLVGEAIYFVSDKGGVVTCLNAKTGEENWVSRFGGNFSASPLYADGKIYFSSREGVVHIIEPNPKKFRRLAKNELDGKFFASPIAIDNVLYLRTDQAMYRIEKK